jgi:hypothetical protein
MSIFYYYFSDKIDVLFEEINFEPKNEIIGKSLLSLNFDYIFGKIGGEEK